MSDSNTDAHTKGGAKASPTDQEVIPPPAQGQGRTAPRSSDNPALGRKPLFRR
jgi:hypothetical protein